MMKDFLPSFTIKIIQTALILLLFQQISSELLLSNCDGELYFENEECFNNLIKLDYDQYGRFAEDKYGNMFILYSFEDNENKRPFYALKKNGTNYFVDSPKKEY